MCAGLNFEKIDLCMTFMEIKKFLHYLANSSVSLRLRQEAGKKEAEIDFGNIIKYPLTSSLFFSRTVDSLIEIYNI